MSKEESEANNEELQEAESPASATEAYDAEESVGESKSSMKGWQMTTREPHLLQQMIEQMPSHAEMPHRSHLYSAIGEEHSTGSTLEESSSSLPMTTLEEEADEAPSEVEEFSASTELKQSQSIHSILRPRVHSVSSAKTISISEHTLKASSKKIKTKKSSSSLASRKVTKNVKLTVEKRSSSLNSLLTVPSSPYTETSDLSEVTFKMILAKQKSKTIPSMATRLGSKQSSKKSFRFHSWKNSLSIGASHSSDSGAGNPFHDIDRRASLMDALKDIPRWEDLSERSLDSSSGLHLSGDIEGFEKPVSLIDSNFAIQEEEQDEQEEQEKQDSQSDTTMSSDQSISYIESSFLLPLPPPTRKFSAKSKAVSGLYELNAAKTVFEYNADKSSTSEDGLGRDLVSEVIEDFLADLFDRLLSVHKKPIRELLDKEKLHQAIVSAYGELEGEISLNVCLQRGAVEYCLRKKQYSYVRENNGFDSMNYECYYSFLAKLDRLLLTEKETISKSRSLSASLAKQLECERIASKQKLQELEETMRSTLLFNERHTHIAETLEKTLADMTKLRNNLSQVRIELYCIQHRLAHMEMKSKQIANVRDGVDMSSYLTLEDTIDRLNIRILERTADLKRLRHMFKVNILSQAHLRCKDIMCQQRYQDLLDLLFILKWSLQNCRKLLHQGRLEHKYLQREIHRIRSTGTILHLPALMRDYKETVTKVNTKHAAVAKLRTEYSRLMDQLESAESKCLKIYQVESQETRSQRPTFFLRGVSMHSAASMRKKQ